MTDAQFCTCCEAPGSMRCSACYAVGIVVPFCSVEHQKLIWCTHKAICGRVLTESYVGPPPTEEEYLAFVLAQSPDSGPGTLRIENLVPANQRPFTVPGNSVRTADDLPPVYQKAFRREWISLQRKPAVVVHANSGRTNTSAMFRQELICLLIDPAPLPADNILGPSLPPSILPYMLLSQVIHQLYRQEAVSGGTNAIAYVNSLVVYATVASRYMLDPMDSPMNHLAQLQELRRRAGLEAGRIKERGTMVGPIENFTPEKRSLVDWSLFGLEVIQLMIEQKEDKFPRLRREGV